ncbi:DegT/DnrJ/EryC1/StrS family aminotransferase [Candidatus Pelagibacter sp.]|nr:DegT/DnrJ/EryC1/StrS family aminotransferase [Candidatus Pelagibacter sp.]
MTKYKYLPMANPDVGMLEAKAAFKVIKNGWISMGKTVQEFETKVQKLLNVKNAIFVNNGTSALHCTLLALRIGRGDEVIVPTLSYISSANSILYCGAKPVFCESDPNTFNVTPEMIENKITKRTKAIMTVDLKGLPIDFKKINLISKKYKIPLISDSAESFGAIYKNKFVGSQAFAHTFSFFANKNITMGEGGLITTQNKKFANLLRIIRNQGQNYRYNHIELGNNFRPTDYAAAIGLEQIKKINSVINEKAKIAKIYSKSFKNLKNVFPPFVPKYASRPSWYLYCLNFSSKGVRDRVMKALKKNNIDTRLSFPPIHLQPYYKKKFKNNMKKFKNTTSIYNKFLDIPCWPKMGNQNINKIIKIIKDNAI